MGFLKSIVAATKMGMEVERNAPPMETRLADAMASLQQVQGTIGVLSEQAQAEIELRASGVRATGTCTAVRGGLGEVNGCPILDIDLLVMADGHPPRPTTLRTAVQLHSVHKVTVGAALPILTDPATGRTALDSAALAAG
ncbi:MAG: hypothetical protein ACO1PW_07335 [Actinomycetota bacterium]